jgi:hypothetical protein
MAAAILVLFVIVIGRAGAGSRTRADKCTFPPANQRPCSGSDGGTDADAFRSLLFTRFRISIASALPARDGNCERKGEQ